MHECEKHSTVWKVPMSFAILLLLFILPTAYGAEILYSQQSANDNALVGYPDYWYLCQNVTLVNGGWAGNISVYVQRQGSQLPGVVWNLTIRTATNNSNNSVPSSNATISPTQYTQSEIGSGSSEWRNFSQIYRFNAGNKYYICLNINSTSTTNYLNWRTVSGTNSQLIHRSPTNGTTWATAYTNYLTTLIIYNTTDPYYVAPAPEPEIGVLQVNECETDDASLTLLILGFIIVVFLIFLFENFIKSKIYRIVPMLAILYYGAYVWLCFPLLAFFFILGGIIYGLSAFL